jgi:hypothetical protein
MTIDLNKEPIWISSGEGTIHTLIIYKSSGIIVHRHVDYPDMWLLSGKSVLGGVDKVVLHNKELEQAKDEAMERMYSSINNITQRLSVMLRHKKV